jgi:hypothetical protein
MKYFWFGFWLFLTFLVVAAAAVRPETIDGILFYTGAYLVVVGWVVVVLVAIVPVALVIGGGVLLWSWVRKVRTEHLRQRDGSFALQQLDPKKPVVFYDPNQQVGSAAAWVPGTGWVEYDGGAGWDNQRQIAAQRSLVARVQAAAPGDRALGDMARELKHSDGVGGWLKGMRAVDARWAERTPKGWGEEKPPKPVLQPSPQLPPPPVEPAIPPQLPPPTVGELVQASQATRIAFGRQPETGELAVWDLLETPHLRLHGGTQKGKTSAAIAVVAGMLVSGTQVVVLNPKAGNWQMLQEYAEVADVRRPEAFAAALRLVHAEFTRRDALLAAQKAKDILALSRAVRPPRLAVVVEEYGAQRYRAQAAGTLPEVDKLMSELASEAAASGIHLIAIDQRPTNYDPFVKANLGAVAVFNLPDDGAGKASGYARAHKLPQYHFWYDGDIYRSADATGIEALLRRALPPQYPPVLVAPPPVPQPVPGAVFAGVPPEVDVSQDDVANTANAADLGKWYEFIIDYMARSDGRELWQTPPRGVRQLARAMSVAETGREDNEDSYVGIASRVTKRIREEARLSNGSQLGVDVTLQGE